MAEPVQYFLMIFLVLCREPLFYIPAGVFLTLGVLFWGRTAITGALAPGRVAVWLGLPTLLALANLGIAAVMVGQERPIGTWALGLVVTVFLAQLPLAAWLSWRMERYWLGTLLVCLAQFWLACLTTLIAALVIVSSWF